MRFIIAIIVIIFCSIYYFPSEANNDPDFTNLKEILLNYGFTIKQEIPPYISKNGFRPYGLMDIKSKTIWINPIVFELGNANSVLIHEAVHAAQSCKGKDDFQLLNLGLIPPQITRPYFMRYHAYQREVEAEAYTVQVQPNGLAIAIKLLEQNCSTETQQ